ncbi:DUF4114 domain-containing protein [Polaribacter vadi]|uniref:DUF4114 domain-containing protein n=1 Tax=Polaribacter TaxID=52959 RepID=UPI001C0864E5|nr:MULTISPECIES: DUF4114 domain-containing protein [Polaribacter]MBU3013055.1 DUF4114 domain-containing protein [Polaribacter vadi]MDO6742873.1 DUF4114 domain-containing protein [Polaribacter sp. 1_MG-2023]
MKKLLLILTITFVSVLQSQTYSYLGEYSNIGVPLYLESERDVVSNETLEMINKSLPENYPVPDYNPQYITAGYDTDIKLNEKADVWVTFVSEGAGFKNTLGFYTYDLDSPLTESPALQDITIIFPNASALHSGGGLQVGDKVKIGNFEAGTGIGWVLIANGWSQTTEVVGWGNWRLYSNPDFNPENNEELRNHNVLLADPDNERVILGFEDLRRDYGSDDDFNDAIFYVTASPYTAIITDNLTEVTEDDNITSANDGGLESNGSLANLIAKRNFTREKVKNNYNKKENQEKYSRTAYKSKSNTISLAEYLPETGMYKTEVAKVSSPEDLLDITNAKEIFSLDMYLGEKRVSAVLATTTEGKIYDHSKIICDRLNNSSLEDIRTIQTRGHQIIASSIKRATGELEHTLSFSIKTDSDDFELFSFWNIEQYPDGDYQNFQIWGSSFSQVFTIANHIIDTHTELNGLKSTKVDQVLPNVFVKSGKYLNGVIELQIVNKTNETSVDFVGSIANTEVSNHQEVRETFTLTGNYNEVLKIETGVLFDIGFSLETASSLQKDALYLADGPWGLDYLEDLAEVNEFNITTEERVYDDNNFDVDRNISLAGNVKGNINLFRHLLPGDQTLEATEFNFMNFKISNNQPVEIVIMQEDDRTWDNRLRYTIPANSDKNIMSLSFDMFKDANGTSAEIKNIKTIVFSVIGDYSTFKSFNLTIDNLSLSASNSVLSTEEFSILDESKVVNYPNPFSSTTTIVLPTTSSAVQIKVFDLLGRVVDFKNLDTLSTNNKVSYTAPSLGTGIYKYVLKDDSNKTYKGTFVIRQ